MEDEKYIELRKRYPPYVSKEQLWVICRIAKRSAKYLLDNGIIPCEDTGKKTRRYRVALDDIIVYLKKRDDTGNSQIPCGEASSKSKKAHGPKSSYSQAILSGQEDDVRRYFEYIFSEFPDVLTTYDVTEMTGLALATVLRLIQSGAIRSMFVDRQHIIPKEYMLDFVSSAKFLSMKSNSIDFKRVLGGFSIWKTQKS